MSSVFSGPHANWRIKEYVLSARDTPEGVTFVENGNVEYSLKNHWILARAEGCVKLHAFRSQRVITQLAWKVLNDFDCDYNYTSEI